MLRPGKDTNKWTAKRSEKLVRHYRDGGLREMTTDDVVSLYEELWTSMVADPDALAAVRAYAWPEMHRKRRNGKEKKKNRHMPPAAYFEVVELYLNLRGIHYCKSPSDKRDEYYEAKEEAGNMTPKSLVDSLARLARQWADHRAQARTQREASAGDPTLWSRPGTGGWVPQSPDDVDGEDDSGEEGNRHEHEDGHDECREAHYAGWPIPEGCAESGYEYLVVATAAWMDTIAVLLAVPRQACDAAPPDHPGDGGHKGREAHVLGREWNHYPEGMAKSWLAPSSTFAPALRPYASIVPTLLWSMADAQSLLQWGKETDRQKARERERSPVDRALDPLVAQLKRAHSIGELPPEVMFHLPIKPSSFAMYAWFSEGQLAIALNVAFGRHAAATSLLYAARFPMIPGLAVNIDHQLASATASVDRLDVMTARALTENPTRIEWTALPEDFRNALGFAVWQAITLGHNRPDDSSALPRHDDVDYFEGLVRLAQAWGIEPTEAQLRHPVLLCGALSREAIMRKVHQAQVIAEASARLGGPRLTWHERQAWKDICESHPSRRFARVRGRMRKPRDADQVCRKIYVKIMGPVNNDKDIAMIESLNALFLKANTQHDKRKSADIDVLREEFHALLAKRLDPDFDMEAVKAFLAGEGKKLFGDDSSDDEDIDEQVADDECPPLPAKTQAVLAMFALRSGIPIEADDLANAGRALAALTPAIALTT